LSSRQQLNKLLSLKVVTAAIQLSRDTGIEVLQASQL